MTKEGINKGIQLKFAREYRGFSQSDLAKKIKGLSQSNLSKFEKGFDGMIKDDKLIEIIKHLNFPESFLNITINKPFTSWD